MQDPTRPRATHQLPLTRNHLYAMGALALAVALLAFFVGFSLGRGKAAAPAPAPVARFVPDEVRSGDLEVLLARVAEAHGDAALNFPAELPRTDPPPAAAEPAADGGGVAGGATPPPQEEPPTNPFPAEARPGGAAVAGEPVAAPIVDENVPKGGWAVQVAEHAVEADAARNVETLRAAGLEAYRIVALVGGETVWRVRVGGYSSKDAASAAVPAVASKAGASSASVAPAP